MTETLPVNYEPVAASAAIGSPLFAVPPPRIAARRIRACAARARIVDRCFVDSNRGLAVAVRCIGLVIPLKTMTPTMAKPRQRVRSLPPC